MKNWPAIVDFSQRCVPVTLSVGFTEAGAANTMARWLSRRDPDFPNLFFREYQ
jgi:type IV secretory pathway TrbD component